MYPRILWLLLLAAISAATALLFPELLRAQETGGTHMPMPTPIPKRATSLDESTSSDNEVDVYLVTRAIGTQDVTALLIGQTVFIQPFDVFNFIHVKADASPDGMKLSGYYIDEERKYTFDNTARSITYQEKVTNFTPDEYIVRSDGAFLRADLFEKIFNLQCIFNYRSLTVLIKSGEPLPAESELKFAAARKGINSFTAAQEKPDATFDLARPLFSLGVLDYNAATTYRAGDPLGQAQTQYQLYGGGQLLGGDMDATFAGQTGQGVIWKDLPWQWRYAVLNSNVVRHILIGREDPLFTAMQLPDSMAGFEISNVNNQFRTSFANYTISDHTQPDWTVELYVNDALVNYTKADQTGYYKFVVPLSYGTTNIKLKFYGPYGEVRTSVVALQIPYTFLPPGDFEYTLTGGTSIAHPGIKNSTGQLDTKLGISSWITAGGGIRYVTYPGITNGNLRTPIGEVNYIPYGSASITPFSELLLSGEYYEGSGYRGRFSFTVPGGVAVEGEYDKPFLPSAPAQATGQLNPLQYTNPFFIQDQRKLAFSSALPFDLGSLRVQATDVPINTDSGYLSLAPEALISVFGTAFNVSANGNFLRDLWKLHSTGDISGAIGMSLMDFGSIIRPNISVDYTTRTVSSAQVEITRTLGDWGNFQLALSHTFQGVGNSVQLSFRTILPAVQLGMSSGVGTGQPVTSTATVAGSVGYDAGGVGFYGGSRAGVRRGGMEVIPFLDENENGKWAPGEPLVPKFGFEHAPGRVTVIDSGILRYQDMEPYRYYFLKTSTAGLDNISLVPKFTTFAVTPSANGFTRIEIPLASAGQFDGYVTAVRDSQQVGVGGVRLKVRHWEPGIDTSEVKLTEDLLSYSNGEFYYEGILPGKYRLYIDPNQLRILHSKSDPPWIDLTVKSSEDGDVIEGLNFALKKLSATEKEHSEVVK